MRLIDMHCDTILLLMRDETVNLGKNQLCVDIEKLKKAGSMAQFFACFIHMSDFTGEDRFCQAYQQALNMIARGKKEFSDYEDQISLALSYEDLVKNKQQDKISAFLTVEEGGILDGDISRLDALYSEGVRLITLTWNHENCIGYPNSKEPEQMKKGLKPFGIEVIERMNELGIIIDVSHLSDGGFWDVVKHSKKPIVASHSNARSLCEHPRNLTDEMMRAMAEKGGIAGVNFYPYFLKENGKATALDIALHVKHMYNVGGEDFVAIGTDFDGFDDGELNVAHMGQMEVVYDAISKQGFTEKQMDKILFRNALRVMKEVL